MFFFRVVTQQIRILLGVWGFEVNDCDNLTISIVNENVSKMAVFKIVLCGVFSKFPYFFVQTFKIGVDT